MTKVDTNMIQNLLECIQLKQDSKTLSVELPRVLQEATEGKDYEIIISKTAQRLTLFHRSSLFKSSYQNIVSNSTGLIFINTNFKGKVYNRDLLLQG